MTINRAKAAIAKREATLQRLTKLLSAERRLNTALSNLAFLPPAQQRRANLKELKKAMTIKRKLMEGA